MSEKARQTINADVDRLIDGDEVDEIMGGQSQSTRYADPDLRKLAIAMTSPDRKSKRVRWLLSEVLELRRQRIAAARARADAVQQRVIEQNARRRQRRRVTRPNTRRAEGRRLGA